MYDTDQLNCFKSSSSINNSDSIGFEELDQAISAGRISSRSKKKKNVTLISNQDTTESSYAISRYHPNSFHLTKKRVTEESH